MSVCGCLGMRRLPHWHGWSKSVTITGVLPICFGGEISLCRAYVHPYDYATPEGWFSLSSRDHSRCGFGLYYRFALSTANVEDLLAATGVIVSRETVRLWVSRFGQHFAGYIRRDRPQPQDKCHMDEVAILIRGKKHWL